MSNKLGITRTGDWIAILDVMRQELTRLKDNIIAAAGAGKDVEKVWGIYDGYRRAIEKLESFGVSDG